MSYRAFWILCALALATSLLALGAVLQEPAALKVSAANESAFPALQGDLDRIAKVEISWRGARDDFTREEGEAAGGARWRLEQRDYPADGAKIKALLSGLAALDLAEPRTADPDLYRFMDLDRPGDKDSHAVSVKLFDKDGQAVATAVIGRRAGRPIGQRDDGTFILRADDPQSWLAAGTLELPRDIVAWLDKDLISLKKEQVAELAVTRPETGLRAAIREAADKDWTARSGAQTLPEKSVTALLDALAGLSVMDVAKPDEEPVAAEGPSLEVGLFGGARLHFALEVRDGKNWVSLEVRQPGDAAGDDETQAALRRLAKLAGDHVFRIESSLRDSLFPKLEDAAPQG
jgi:hypothetical protein